MKHIYLTLVAVAFAVSATLAQRECGTMDHQTMIMGLYPQMQQIRQQIEQFTEDYIHNEPNNERILVTIPVVVHVVWNTSSENISDAQILSQITVLNNDFRRLNSDASNTPTVWQSIAADCEINFCMATVDPNGNATNGITRTYTSTTAFSTNDNVKFNSTGGKDAWPASSYLNLWVCDLSGGLLGYAQFPGGPASTDGVVCDYQYFGTIGTATAPFHLGRTATHEVGHWLNCYHIWGDDGTSCSGSDLVSDTPNQGGYNVGCPSFPKISCSNGPNGDMFMNYMDYSDDGCMNLFTAGQKARMQALFASGGARYSLLSSNGCGTPNPCGTPTGLATSSITSSGAAFSWSAVSGASSYNVRYKLTTSSTWTTASSATTSYTASGLAACSNYEWQVSAVCSSGSSPYTSSVNFSTTGCTSTCNTIHEVNNTSSQAFAIAANTNVGSYICPAYDDDWFSCSNTSSQKHIKVTLTSLPFDYDVYLYNPSGVLVGQSINGGTTNETIIYNNGPVGTYKIKVIGYNGAFHNTDSYIVKFSRKSTAWREDGTFDEPTGDISLLAVYPNPSNDKVNVSFNVETERLMTIELFDMMGRVVYTRSFTSAAGENITAVDLSAMARGCYTLRLRDDASHITSRVCRE